MNQQCKVCGEPAAGFHFGAFTCEGCKSFFGRSYNNLNSISECKNGGECVINKKNRTACKACRLRKCLLVGMSKSGSRYGRRSNWFKIHCLLQEQQQQQQQQQQQHHHHHHHHHPHHQGHHHQAQNQTSPSIGHPGRKDDVLLLGLDDYKNSTSPSISSPESLNSESSVEVSERRAALNHPGFRPLHSQHSPDLSVLSKEMMGLPLGFPLNGMSLIPPAFLPPPSLSMFSPYHLYAPHGTPHPLLPSHTPGILQHTPMGAVPTSASTPTPMNNNHTTTNNNNRYTHNQNTVTQVASVSPGSDTVEAYTKRFYLDAVLKSQRTPPSYSPASSKAQSEDNSARNSPEPEAHSPPPQEIPIDLSMKAPTILRENSTPLSIKSDEDVDMEDNSDRDSPPIKRRPAPIDLTTRV